MCSLQYLYPEDMQHCLSADQNQIVIGKNEISVFAGSKSLNAMGYSDAINEGSHQWNMDRAYLMDGFNHPQYRTNIDRFDVGILITTNKQLFNPELLNQKNELGRADIVPVCLAAVSTPLGDKKLKLLGWGIRYEERPGKGGLFTKRDPILSSCMTNQAGPLQWRFQNCHMKKMKKGKLFKSWSCETKKPPPSYTTLEEQKCEDYFSEAIKSQNQLGVPSSLIEEQDQLHFTATDDTIVSTCYNPDLLKKRGWCKLFEAEGFNRGKQPWGICSSSCNKTIIKVLISAYH